MTKITNIFNLFHKHIIHNQQFDALKEILGD